MDRRHSFDPNPERIDEKDPRTQRAYREAMQVSLARTGGRYTVYSASGNIYDVDVVEGTCSCGDYRECEPEGGCKHLRRVDLEIRGDRVPTPDGRLPARPAADGGQVATGSGSGMRSTDRVQGPITEFGADGTQTGAEYYRCRVCGTEAMRKRDLTACCEDRDQ